MKLTETTVQKNYIYRGRIVNFRNDDALLPDGRPCQREVVEHPGGVTVAALTAQDELLFARQYRYCYETELLELPAGKLEAGENPLEAGKRELREEVGAVAARYDFLGEFYPTPGYCNEIIYLYLARDLTFCAQDLDEDEFIHVEKIPLQTAIEMVMDNRLKDGKTQAVVLKIAQLRREGVL